MLEIGRRKPHGQEIEWVQSFAQAYRSDKLFDMIIMTGHAFQVLLEDADILATFSMMNRKFVFLRFSIDDEYLLLSQVR